MTPHKTKGTGRYFTPELVLHHEYAHHFMLQYFPAIYPSWYVEGFAELIGSSKMMDDGRIGYGMPALHRGNEINAYWVPLQDLLTKDKVVYLDTYGQGWALTNFLTFNSKHSIPNSASIWRPSEGARARPRQQRHLETLRSSIAKRGDTLLREASSIDRSRSRFRSRSSSTPAFCLKAKPS